MYSHSISLENILKPFCTYQKKDENERRWARGTFVKALNTQLRVRAGKDRLPRNWRTWLCTNPDSEQTAIWLEQKFDVPNSGVWESDTVFTIFCDEEAAGEGYPGLILFECTSLDGVTDEIEKYVIYATPHVFNS